MFWSKNKKKVYTCKPQFHYIKVGCKGVFVTRNCFRDEQISLHAHNMLCKTRNTVNAAAYEHTRYDHVRQIMATPFNHLLFLPSTNTALVDLTMESAKKDVKHSLISGLIQV